MSSNRNESQTLIYNNFATEQPKGVTLESVRNQELERVFKEQLRKDAEELWKNNVEIKQMLHPAMPEEVLPDQAELKRAAKDGVLLSQILQ